MTDVGGATKSSGDTIQKHDKHLHKIWICRDVIEGTEEGRKNPSRGSGGRLGPQQGPGAVPR